jgi:hypothetical protein
MHLVEAGSWRTVHSSKAGGFLGMVAATRDGQKLALIGSADSGNSEPQIEIWDLPQEQLRRRLPPGFTTSASITFSEDGRYLLSQAMQGTRIYDTTTFSVWTILRFEFSQFQLVPARNDAGGRNDRPTPLRDPGLSEA